MTLREEKEGGDGEGDGRRYEMAFYGPGLMDFRMDKEVFQGAAIWHTERMV